MGFFVITQNNSKMRLEELEKKIYRPGEEFGERPRSPEIFSPGQREKKIRQGKWLRTEKSKLTPKQKQYLRRSGIFLIIGFLIAAGFMIWRSFISFDKSKVKLEISGPERIESGDEAVYAVKYGNKSKITLKDIKLVFYFPEDSLLIETANEDLIQSSELSDLGAGQESWIELKARIIGQKDSQKKVQARLSFRPANLGSRFENQAEFLTKIISVPLILDFDLPNRLVSGQSFDFSLEYLNQGEVAFKNLELKLEYPAGFNFKSAEPEPLERNNLWPVSDLMAGGANKIFIHGAIEGRENERKSFKAQLGVLRNDQFILYTETVEAVQISVSPLFVSQTVNGKTDYVAKAGEVLNYQIDYKNTTDVGIKDVVITSQLDGSALDLASLELEKGSFDGLNRVITWNAGNLPALEFLGPRQEGKVEFRVKIKDSLPIKNYSDKNFSITNTVKINSSQIPLSLASIQVSGQSQLTTKIASQLTLEAKGYFRDDLIPNSGPIPPRVGQATTYTIKWQVSNTSNDLKNVKVAAYLPPHIQWLGKVKPSEEDLKYNSGTGQLIWSIGDLAAATGLLLPVKQIAFQVAITPSLTHAGGLVELIGQSIATGKDSFTGLELTSADEPIDTDLPDDLTVNQQDGIVAE